MSRKLKVVLPLVLLVILTPITYRYLSSQNMMLLSPKGSIGLKERNLIYFAVIMMLLVVLPVYFMAFWFPLKYGESSKKPAEYTPNWDRNATLETIWWGIPIAIIGVIAVVTWVSTHQLDPFKPIEKDKPQMTIQVVAMQWKWLFIYPKEGIVSVNHVAFPKDTAINFQITSDAPMNSFWIPQLGGQIYAMSGMSTQLHLIGNEAGKYEGLSANISGSGFSDMRFVAQVMDGRDYDQWVAGVKSNSGQFGISEYKQLSIPSIANPPQYFVLSQNHLYDMIVAKYMNPAANAIIDGKSVYTGGAKS